MALLDQTVITRLVATRLRTASGVSVVLPGDPDPERSAKWCRLLAVDVRPNVRNIHADEPAHAAVLVVCAVMVSVASLNTRTSGSAYAASSAAASIAKVLDMAYLADGDHALQLERAIVEPETTADEQRSVVSASFSVEGYAQRNTGTSLETHPQ